MGDSDETSPDLLKNTPSNIARLEDVIEHSEGRQKYLAQTRSLSDGGDVRWYFCKIPLLPNELAASLPRTEVVAKGDYFRFGMRDSLAIEASFLQREEELLSSWWKEYAECSEGPRGETSKKLEKQPSLAASEAALSAQVYEVEEERVGVPVKGGLYEVDLVKRHCFPVYWDGDNRRVLRGHWFARKGGLDWLPLREDVAEQLEIAYRSKIWRRRTFQPSGLFAARVELQGSIPGLHSLFTGEDDTWEAWLNVDASGFSSVINFSGNGIKLRRGYSKSISAKPSQDELRQQKEEEMDDYCSQVPVRHLVFMVHGIGQRLEKSNLVDDVGNFRHITASLAEQHLTPHQLGTQRVLFIPCQWRKGLKLSCETAVEKITLDGVRGLRVTLSATVHDVLYYMSPIYSQHIINSVSNQLNLLYLKFLKRNPGYDGKVSIYGHSLGSVLSYDILCHQENLFSRFPMKSMYKDHDAVEESSCSVGNQPSKCDSPTNLGGNNSTLMKETKDKVESADEDVMSVLSTQPSKCDSPTNLEGNSSTLMNETKDKVESADEDMMSVQSTQLMNDERASEDFSSVGPVRSGAATAMDSDQRVMEDVHDLVHGSGDIVSLDEGAFNEATPMISGVANGELEKVAGKECNDSCDKDNTIDLLKKEIDSLRAKLAELETQCHGNNEVHAVQPKQPLSEKQPPMLDDDTPMSYTPYIKYTKLEFKIDTFFAVGSPLGVFLALRNIRIGIGKGQDYWDEENICEEMPACRQMFNIFHPYDPVAYRIEPLVCKEYLTKRPVIIPYHRGGKRLHIGFQEFTEDLAARSQAIVNHFNSVRVKVLTVCQSRSADGLEDGAENAEEREEKSYGTMMMESLTGSEGGRIDHMLQDKTFEHPYLQAIGSHTNYWRDYDTVLFILKHLYRGISEDPNSSAESSENNSKSESGATGWSDQRETTEEELPLTFSDRIMARNFSKRAKKFIKRR